MNIIARYTKNNLLNEKSLNLLDSPEASKTDVSNKFNKNRFFNSDIEFSNLFYDGKFNYMKIKIKYAGKETYFRNVFVFINRINIVNKIFFKLNENF